MEDAGIIPTIGEEELLAAMPEAGASRKLRTEDIPKPRQLERLETDSELKTATELSKTMWSGANSSYLLRDGKAMKR